jgi:hypothetical protein
MPNSTFELFEVICGELVSRDSFVLTERAVSANILEDLQRAYKMTLPDQALDAAVKAIEAHFVARDAKFPFGYDPRTRMCSVIDADYLKYIADVSAMRGNKKKSREFELAACDRLSKKLNIGHFHHTGWPRHKKKTKAEFREHLESLGFDGNAVDDADKDAGFDILWLPPLGFIPLRPVVSMQCKNASIDLIDAGKSIGRASRSHHRHSTTRAPGCFMSFVLFNDYIEQPLAKKSIGCGFVPLGLTDAAPLAQGAQVVVL